MIGHTIYLKLDWHEEGPLDPFSGERLLKQDRKVYVSTAYPQRLPCSNPECQEGGFEIGQRIAALLTAGIEGEQKSLICRNALHKDHTKKCWHTILYSINCVYPYRHCTARENTFRLKMTKM